MIIYLDCPHCHKARPHNCPDAGRCEWIHDVPHRRSDSKPFRCEKPLGHEGHHGTADGSTHFTTP